MGVSAVMGAGFAHQHHDSYVTDVPDPLNAAASRELVRRGYDTISHAYRSDDGSPNTADDQTRATYVAWLEELTTHLLPGARILDLGCGPGVPADRWLTDAGFAVTGVDISQVQIDRARQLVPPATFIRHDIATFEAHDQSFDAVVSFYALIHLPLEDQRAVFPRIRRWVRPDGLLMVIVGHERWTGVEEYLGAPMFWDHADSASYEEWLRQDGFDILWTRFIPEGTTGHALLLARAQDRADM